MGRRAILAAGLIVALSVLAGCSVPPGGWAALMRGEDDDSLNVVVQMCTGSVDGVTISSVVAGSDEILERAYFDAPVDDSGRVEVGMINEMEESTYHLYGWTLSNTTSAAGMDFTRAEIAGVEPGNILAKDLDDTHFALRSFTPAAFRAMVLAHCDD